MRALNLRILTRLALCAAVFFAPPLSAGSLNIATGTGLYTVQVNSIRESKFLTTIPQQYDYSCGSAALATLLTHHYENPTTERRVFDAMWEHGDKTKIRREGFSLLDMKSYLQKRGYKADGFYLSLDKLHKLGVPAIALIDRKGYKHFVVIKGVEKQHVLLGDPALGAKIVARKEFKDMWNGLMFVVRNKKDVAQAHFNRDEDWRVTRQAYLDLPGARNDLANVTLLLPQRNDF